MFSIWKSSIELNNASEPRWHFPSAFSPEAHAEWGLYKILEYMGLHEILPPGSGKNRAKLRKDIEEYLTAYAIDLDDADIDTFIALRPDVLAFDMEEKLCVFLEYTSAMPWTQMKIGQRGRSRRKITDTAPYSAPSTTSATGRKAAGKPLKPISPQEYEASYTQTSSLRSFPR